MPPPPFCVHCSQPVHHDPADAETLVHARSGNAMCADGKHEAEVASLVDELAATRERLLNGPPPPDVIDGHWWPEVER